MQPRCRQVFATKAVEILVTFVQNLPEAPVRWRPAPLDPEQVEEDDLERPCPQQAGLLTTVGFVELFELSPSQVWRLQDGLVLGRVIPEAHLLQP